MRCLAWLTDLHLNFLTVEQIAVFFGTLNQHSADVLVISGDLTDSAQLQVTLKMLEHLVQKPVYFVCGNHDYYHSSIAQVRESIPQWLASSPTLTWLSDQRVIELSPTTGLVGHDGWADGRYGNYHTSPLILNDYVLIEELHLPRSQDRFLKVNELGDQAAAHFHKVMPTALEEYQQVIVVTHVPPFAQAALKDGEFSTDFELPHYANRAAGEALIDLAKQHPRKQITVLCGHTHSACDLQILPNLRVVVGHAEYRKPAIQPLVLELG